MRRIVGVVLAVMLLATCSSMLPSQSTSALWEPSPEVQPSRENRHPRDLRWRKDINAAGESLPSEDHHGRLRGLPTEESPLLAS